MLAVHSEGDRGAAAGGDQGETGTSQCVELDLLGSHVRTRRAPDGDHPGGGLRRHRGHNRVVGVEDDHSGVRNGLHQFGFRRGDDLPRTELAEVRGADVEHHRDRRPRDPGQCGDVAGMAC